MSSRATIQELDSPSVLLVRLDAIGDALALTPLLAAFLLAGIPVDVVLRDVNCDALSTGALRRRLVAPFALRSGTSENRDAIGAFADSLRATGYTHTLVATEDASGYLLAYLLRHKTKRGAALLQRLARFDVD